MCVDFLFFYLFQKPSPHSTVSKKMSNFTWPVWNIVYFFVLLLFVPRDQFLFWCVLNYTKWVTPQTFVINNDKNVKKY